MVFKSCKYYTDYCLLLLFISKENISWSFYTKLNIELYGYEFIRQLTEFCSIFGA